MIEQKKNTRKVLLELFWSFCKIGPITFGGGYAMIPQIEREAVQVRHWMSEADIVELLAVSGAAPGAIGVNAAFSIGYRVAGIAGALVAFIGVILPTFLIVLGLSTTYLLFRDNHKVAAAFEGIRPAIVALIVFAAIRVSKSSIVDRSTFAIAIVGLAVLLGFSISPIWAIVASPFVGVAACWAKDRWFGGERTAVQSRKKVETAYVHQDHFFGDGI